MPKAGSGKATAHNATIKTQDNTDTPQPTAVIGTNLTAAQTEAEKRGVPRTRAYDINNIDQITPDDIVVLVRPTADRAANWDQIQHIGCTIIQ